MSLVITVAVALCAVWIVLIVVRSVLFRPVRIDGRAGEADVPPDAPFTMEQTGASLSRMIRIPTVSAPAPALNDGAPFAEFRELLAELYPRITSSCLCERVGETGVLYTLKGRSPDRPTVLMAHYDVVPADETDWVHPAFSGHIDETGRIWGRGAIDTKVTLCAIMEAVERRLSEGFTPEHDVYLAFSGDEEVFGPSAPAIVALLESRGVRPALVLDEGGAVVDGIFPGVTSPCAVIGIAEKGMMNVELSVVSNGGHASAPPKNQPVRRLSRAIHRIAARPFPLRFVPAVAALFDTLGRHAPFALRLIFANLWCFLPVLKRLFSVVGGEMEAMMRTTTCFTVLEGSAAFNVMPSVARAIINIRILSGESSEKVLEGLRSRVADPSVRMRVLYATEPTATARLDGREWNLVSQAVRRTWDGTIVAPYLMVACTDSRHFGRLCDTVLKFSALELSREERASMHGRNECLPVKKLVKCCSFYYTLTGDL